jgi:uncharacterized membrane-anchored protein YitT (DUF2179 family)
METDNKGTTPAADPQPGPDKKANPTGATPVYHKQKPTMFQKEVRKVDDYLLDHPVLKGTIDWSWSIFLNLVSAFAFAYGYRAFIAPGGTTGVSSTASLISGGASGISQIILRLFQIFNYSGPESMFTSVCYLCINIPLFFIAFKFIGKRFFLLTAINVGATSLFINYIPEAWVTIFNINSDNIARALFAGVLTGVSSGLAYFVGDSAGGLDIINFYLAERKSTTVGKYSLFFNTCIVILYSIVNAIKVGDLTQVTMALYTIIYFFTASKVLDVINIKNKKTELQINTDNEEMAQLLLRAFPHGCTVINGIGGYTGKPRKLIYMVVSASEVKQVIEFARRIDPNCFVNVTNSTRVYGKFYTKPIQ